MARFMSSVQLFDAIGSALALLSATLLGFAAFLWLWSLTGAPAMRPARQAAKKLASYAGLALTFSLFAGAYAWAGQ